jgi:hypothetical protein
MKHVLRGPGAEPKWATDCELETRRPKYRFRRRKVPDDVKASARMTAAAIDLMETTSLVSSFLRKFGDR